MTRIEIERSRAKWAVLESLNSAVQSMPIWAVWVEYGRFGFNLDGHEISGHFCQRQFDRVNLNMGGIDVSECSGLAYINLSGPSSGLKLDGQYSTLGGLWISENDSKWTGSLSLRLKTRLPEAPQRVPRHRSYHF